LKDLLRQTLKAVYTQSDFQSAICWLYHTKKTGPFL